MALPISASATPRITGFDTNVTHNCITFVQGTAKCWGDNSNRRLGYDTADYSISGEDAQFLDSGENAGWKKISHNWSASCGVLTDGRVKCWNYGYQGIGLGDTIGMNNATAVRTPALAPILDLPEAMVDIDVENHICALSVTGKIYCWGFNNEGQLGIGTADSVFYASDVVAVDLGVDANGDPYTAKSISLGTSFVCAVLNTNEAKCWGSNGLGQLGQANNDNYGHDNINTVASMPVIDFGNNSEGDPLKVRQISSGALHACAILENSQVKCWGYNEYGELGRGDKQATGGVGFPVKDELAINLGADYEAVDVSSGGYHTCVVLSDGDVHCWGANSLSGLSGMLGLGHTNHIGDNEPVTAANTYVDYRDSRNVAMVDIEASYYHTCGIMATEEIKCWGNNSWGQSANEGGQPAGDDEFPNTISSIINIGNEALRPLRTGADNIVTGILQNGSTLTCENGLGAWSGYPVPVITYQWKRDGSDIALQTSATYELTAADIGTQISCEATATNAYGTETSESDPTTLVEPTYTTPSFVGSGQITGPTTVGSTLSCQAPTLSGYPVATVTYQWKRNGANIAGAVSNTYELTVLDAGTQVSCEAVATNSEGSTSSVSTIAVPTLPTCTAGQTVNCIAVPVVVPPVDPPAQNPGTQNPTNPAPAVSPVSDAVIINIIKALPKDPDIGFTELSGGSVIPLAKCTIIGTPKNDVLKGTSKNDVICGLGGNDVILGGGGNDIIDGGFGNDKINAGAGNDYVYGMRGNDIIDGGLGNDKLYGGIGNDKIIGGRGNDLIYGGSGKDTVRAGAGNDGIVGGTGNDKLYGETGKDKIAGQAGNDYLHGGIDLVKDVCMGGPGKDVLVRKIKYPKRGIISVNDRLIQ